MDKRQLDRKEGTENGERVVKVKGYGKVKEKDEKE